MTGETADLIFPQSEIRKAMCWSNFKNMDSCDIFDLISQRGFPAVWLLLLLAGCLPPHGGSGLKYAERGTALSGWKVSLHTEGVD